MKSVLNKIAHTMNKKLIHVPVWAWLVAIIGTLFFHNHIAAFLFYGACVGLAIGAIALMFADKHAKKRFAKLLVYSVVLAAVAGLLNF